MDKLIEKLTPKQQKLHDAWHKQCFDIGSSTEPADKPGAEARGEVGPALPAR